MVDLPASGARSSPACLAAVADRRGGRRGGASLVSGCSVDNADLRRQAPRPTAGLAPDVAVATRALAEIRAVRAAVEPHHVPLPGARPDLAPLVQMHRAHEASLVDAVPDRARPSAAPAPYVVPRKREVALRQLAAREQRLHDTLDGLALRAQSGDFARLLASMGAAVSQRLAVWPS